MGIEKTLRTARARSHRLALAGAAVALALAAVAAEAGGQGCDCEPYTFMLSQSASGGLANGPSRNGVISQDNRIASAIAFESDASNIVGGARTASPTSSSPSAPARGASTAHAGAWAPGASSLGASRRTSRQRALVQAGDQRPHRPGASLGWPSSLDASNLVRGNTDRRPDAFVYSF